MCYNYQKIKALKLLFLVILLFFIPTKAANASGAYDKGTSAGKGNFELNLTLNPFGLISYGQDYAILSYGIFNKTDLVTYFSKHRNGTKSIYWGILQQFVDSQYLDLSTAIGRRKTFDQEKNNYDLFFPQLLYNLKLNDNYTIGGSIVKVIENSQINKGTSIDITFYSKFNSLKKISNKIIDAYFGFGLFKNTNMDLKIDDLYLQYSIDIKFNLKN